MNPLLDFSGLPRFDAFNPDHVSPAIDALLADVRAVVAELETGSSDPTWDNFVAPLEAANEKLGRAWSQVSHLNAVVNDPALRAAYNTNLPKLTQLSTELAQNQRLFRRYRQLRDSALFAALTPAQQKVVDNELRDFRLGGADLPLEQKTRFSVIQERLSTLSSRFQDNVLDATNAFELYIDDAAELAGLPEDVLQGMAEAAARDGRAGWKVTLHLPSYLPIMQYAGDRALRERLYRAYSTRASEFGNPEWDNTAAIAEILDLRAEKAALLGFSSYADLSLATKMADSPQQVLDFLNELGARARPYAQRDFNDLEAFARTELGIDHVEPWDVPYVSEKLRIARYAFSEQEVKQYFPEDAVLPGMFKVVESIYGIRIAPAVAPTWHADAKFFEILDANGAPIGQFYLDLYARDAKRGGAWMADAISRRQTTAGVQKPVAFLTCNFSRPVGNKPALFTHDEVTTLFHEFGHGLHHLLTRIDALGVSGINGVEWDAVELPSQFMENFCWDWHVLQDMTRHVESGGPLPRVLYEKMIAARNFQSGMQTVRQLEFALFDMHLHHDFDRANDTPLALLDRVREHVAVVFPPKEHRFPNQFSHIFAGGYAAGYYSYKWAEVLSADAFGLFEEQGVLSPEAGQRFLNEVLSVGGSRPALESFVAFRGREPRIDALLRHKGMLEDA
jgi:oligopeptidase A